MDISFMFKFNNNCFFPFFLMVSFILQLSGVFCDTNHSLAVLQYFFPVFRPGVSSIPHSSVRAGSCLSVLFSRVWTLWWSYTPNGVETITPDYFIINVISVYITHIYSGERDKCSALVTRNNKIRLLEQL